MHKLTLGRKSTCIIDCDASPTMPGYLFYSWHISKHKKGGQVIWRESIFDEFIVSHEKEVAVPYNVNLLDWMLANQSRIPKKLRGLFLLFTKTTYGNREGRLYNRGLFFDQRALSFNEFIYLSTEDKQRLTMNPVRLRVVRNHLHSV